ncbi:LANO_0H09890g1_1 [Lachancea nothofagi CBS 11611]|uniref:LANO_0H09890g1_1 n=1 Tax=Lachancea nothofagi CBS 11611 TaxID=1266666 RepID=A0A1G4KM28_9SACH|nr:LANO_0H09890g1_1 [Lachancea nothofagi CBS 11611]
MSLDKVIDSFKVRIDNLTQDWDHICSSVCETSDDELRLMKAKLDIVQEQNSTIIVDLDRIKKYLNLEEDRSNNVFSSIVDTSLGTLNLPPSSEEEFAITPKEKPGRPSDWLPSISSQKLPRPGSTIERHIHSSQDLSPLNQYPLSFNVHTFFTNHCSPSPWKRKQISESPYAPFKKACPGVPLAQDENEYTEYHKTQKLLIVESPSGKPIVRPQLKPLARPNIENLAEFGCPTKATQVKQEDFKFRMSDNPKTVMDMYQEYECSLRPQILDFEKRFGKGQLSRLPKVRTYQRRRALACEIEKYSTRYGFSIDESIKYFESIRVQNKKTVPWLYNNLNEILKHYG